MGRQYHKLARLVNLVDVFCKMLRLPINGSIHPVMIILICINPGSLKLLSMIHQFLETMTKVTHISQVFDSFLLILHKHI